MNKYEDNLILLVDDSYENIDFLDEALGDLYQIIAAADGESALEIAREKQPDLILLDVVMPGMDGYDVCSELKKNGKTHNIPVIFLTGKKDLEDKNRGFELGAVDYITKPFEIIEVKARVKNQLIVKRAQKYLEYKNRFLESEVFNRSQELSQTQEELRESEEKFRMLFEKSSNAIAFLMPIMNDENELIDYGYLDVNPQFLNLMQKEVQGEILNKRESEIFPLIERSWFEPFEKTVLHGKSEIFEVYHPFLKKYLTGSSFKPQQDKPYFCLMFNDITQQTLYQNELIKAKDKAEESDRLKSAFLANVSHEIRTPLNGIIGFSQLMKQDFVNKGDKKKFQTIVENCSRDLITIIDEIIDFARIESGAFYLDFHSISLNQLINERVKYFKKQLRIKGKFNIPIKTKLPLPNGKDNYLSDRVRLEKILNNLISNAVKFTEFGAITVGYEVDETIRFFVEDTGVGISKENQDFIFQSFRQENEGYNRKHGGIGLGLAITGKMVEQLGGSLELNSEKEKGSTFSVTFPLDRLNPQKNKEYRSEHNISLSEFLKGKTILFWDNNALEKENLEKLLILKKIHLIWAKNKKEMSSNLREHPETDILFISSSMLINEDPLEMNQLLGGYSPIKRILYHKDNQRAPDWFNYDDQLNGPLDPTKLYETLNRLIRDV